ncbi:hypothetical protein APX87_03545 [Escherichia coli]|nr:hypothetical protein APX84_24450 [Escherichia coli]PAZ66990.1 hypothetical protein APX87_03545 [Escherichia coli]
MFSASITLLNGSPFHSPVTRKCIYHLHKTKLAVASSDKRNPRECEDCYSPFTASCRLATVNLLCRFDDCCQTIIARNKQRSLLNAQ